MRIPDYRVWVKKEKKMYGIDGQGGFVDYIRACGEGDAFGTDIQITDDCGDYQSYTFDEVEVMEFTTNRDKEGMKIYEGDIVRGRLGVWDSKDSEDIGIVEFGESLADASCNEYASIHCVGWHYRLIDVNDEGESRPHDHEFPGDVEIIGNIYEDPELLSK